MSKHQIAKAFEHLAGHFHDKAEHDTARGDRHAQMSEHIAKLAGLGKAHSEIAETVAAMSALHSADEEDYAESSERNRQTGDMCQECAKALRSTSKAAGMGDELEPLARGLSRVHGDVPNLTLIPRTGSAPLGKTTIAPQFAHFVETNFDEE